MKKYVAIAPEVGEIHSYLTNWRKYPIIKIIEKKIKYHGMVFSINTDYGVAMCFEIGCPHLNGKNWTIKEV
ncbi:MAG: hypothetical protein WC310_05825 [Patescibacteria group bacterium]|jgi:hypothetical protein